MLNIELLRKRILKNLSRDEVCNLSNIKREDYDLLENGSSIKMLQQDYYRLKDILDLDNKFYSKYVTIYEDLTILGEKRKELGLSLDKMQNITGICRMHLWRMEKGDFNKIEPKNFYKIISGYNITDIENFEPFIKRTGKYKITFINDGTFGILVKEKRLNMKLSQDMLSVISNVNNTLISKIENGTKLSMTYETSLKLMDSLEFTDDEIKKYTLKKVW